jgi:hypothetical protein
MVGNPCQYRGERMKSKNAMVIAVATTAVALLGFGLPAASSLAGPAAAHSVVAASGSQSPGGSGGWGSS